ncbi:MAG: protein kinase [Pirellulales bacterium]
MNAHLLASSVPFSTWVERLSGSGLVPAEAWQSAVAESLGDAERLVGGLQQRGLLTRFQLNAIAEDRLASLRIGNYELLDRLGAGGMGTVFKARHRRMKRVVALKVLAAQLSQNPVFVKRFQREVETLAALGHPNVVMAYDADEADVGHFLVMEFVDGTDLAAHVERHGPMPASLAVDCLLQAARGLAYAHSLDIVHRDVKPHNLLRDGRGVVKVTDLGLARLHQGVDEPPSGNDVTMAGGVIGTVDYMSPEQAIDSTTIDGLSDIYSLGCTLHYLLVGKPPYTGSSLMAILLQHRDAPTPSLLERCPNVPAALDELFQRMLAKDPAQRIRSMTEVADELQRIAGQLSGVVSSGETASSPRPTPTQQETIGLGAAATSFSNATLDLSSQASLAVPPTVLIVEPSRVQASIIRGQVQERGGQVVAVVAKGRDALDAIRTHSPQVVVTSIHLSDLNGLELARQSHSASPAAPPGFVLISSSDADQDPGSLDLPPRTTWLNKPFSAAQLHDAVARVAQSFAGAGASSAPPDASQATRELPSLKPSREQAKVLLVDDSGVARMQVRSTLQGLGFQDFIEAADGAYAIAEAGLQSCQLIVTDYNMPLMDGRALVSYLKQNPATAKIPILMVTTESDPARLEAVRRLGVLAIIEKAFPVAVVRPLVDSLFS